MLVYIEVCTVGLGIRTMIKLGVSSFSERQLYCETLSVLGRPLVELDVAATSKPVALGMGEVTVAIGVRNDQTALSWARDLQMWSGESGLQKHQVCKISF